MVYDNFSLEGLNRYYAFLELRGKLNRTREFPFDKLKKKIRKIIGKDFNDPDGCLDALYFIFDVVGYSLDDELFNALEERYYELTGENGFQNDRYKTL